MSDERQYFRLCSSCKKELPFASTYYACSVSTCNRKRTGLTFCSVSCWEAHLPTMRHREAWAEEQTAPTKEQWLQAQREEQEKQQAREQRSASSSQSSRRVVGVGSGGGAPQMSDDVPRDTLVVVSKLKAYVRARSGGMNTSDGCVEILSDIIRELCDAAIRRAAEEGRRTVLDRDF